MSPEAWFTFIPALNRVESARMFPLLHASTILSSLVSAFEGEEQMGVSLYLSAASDNGNNKSM